MIAAVVPVKRLSDAKSRLATHLSSRERVLLVTALVRRTVQVLESVEGLDHIGMATEERHLAESFDSVQWLPERDGLNGSLAHAAAWAACLHASAVLMVPCDLPFLEGSDIQALLASGSDGPHITIAPTLDGGTGAILLSPPAVISPVFGPDSFRRHMEVARRANVAIRTVSRPGLAREVDTVQDLDYLSAHVPDFGYIKT